jgi:hypothetical protein
MLMEAIGKDGLEKPGKSIPLAGWLIRRKSPGLVPSWQVMIRHSSTGMFFWLMAESRSLTTPARP